MNCDDCKEQILELIEREAIDPEGVRETLDRCPECRAEFDEVKAQLAVASQLPLEAPPDHLDVLILQAAEARTAGRSPAVATLLAGQRPRASLWRQPLAMAAVALLVVGIGISTVSIVRGPRQERVAQAPTVQNQAAEGAPQEDVEEAAGGAAPERIELAKASKDEAAVQEPDAEPPAARPARATRARSPQNKQARGSSREAPAPAAADDEPQRVAVAEAGQAAEPPTEQYDAAELPSLKTADSKDARSFGQATEREGATTERERQCMSTILVFEKRHADNPNFKPTPQQALDAGLCYQLLGERTEAERWLKRAAEDPSTRARATEALKRLE